MQEPTDSAPPATPSPEGHSLSPASRSALLIVFLVVFIDLLGFGIVLPLLPRIGESYVEAVIPGGKENRLNGAVLGSLMAVFSLMQFVFAPIWGRISDRVGRRPVLLIGLGGSVVFYALLGVGASLSTESAGLALVLLFAARIGAGVAGATISTAQAVIADSTPPDKRKHGMALIGAAFGIGFTFGPVFGYFAVRVMPDNLGIVGYAAAALSLVALVLGFRLMPETRKFSEAPSESRRWLDFGALRHALSSRAVGPVLLIFFLGTLGFASFEVTLALLNKDSLDLGEDENYLLFSYVGFILVLTQGFLYRRVARKLTEATLMLIGIVLMGLGVLSLGGVSWAASEHELAWGMLLTWQMLSLAAAVIGFAFLTPSAQALISRRSDAAKQGEILGANQSAASLARILGPVLGLTLYKLTDNHMLPYVFGAGLLLVMLPVMPRIRRGG